MLFAVFLSKLFIREIKVEGRRVVPFSDSQVELTDLQLQLSENCSSRSFLLLLAVSCLLQQTQCFSILFLQGVQLCHPYPNLKCVCSCLCQTLVVHQPCQHSFCSFKVIIEHQFKPHFKTSQSDWVVRLIRIIFLFEQLPTLLETLLCSWKIHDTDLKLGERNVVLQEHSRLNSYHLAEVHLGPAEFALFNTDFVQSRNNKFEDLILPNTSILSLSSLAVIDVVVLRFHV